MSNNNNNNLPVRSRSRGLQRGHVRRYSSGAVARVNPGVVKRGVGSGKVKGSRGLVKSSRRVVSAVNKGVPVVNKRINFAPKVRINTPRDLWVELLKLKGSEPLTFFNNNLEVLREKLFNEYYRNELGKTRSADRGLEDVLEEVLDDIEGGVFEDDWGGGDRIVFSKFGDWGGTGFDDYIVDGDVWSVFFDPFDGELLLKDKPEIWDFDDSKWGVFNFSGAMFLEELLGTSPMDVRDDFSDDELLFVDAFRSLHESNIPFLHGISGNGYDSFLVFPKNLKDVVFDRLKVGLGSRFSKFEDFFIKRD